MSEYSTVVGSMLGVEDTAISSVCSNEVYPEMNLPSERTALLQKCPKYVKGGFGLIFDHSSPEIGIDNNIEYEGDQCENMRREELLPHPTLPSDKSTVPRPAAEKKKYVALKMTASNRSRKDPTMRKKPRSAKKTDEEYVPLAIRERRRDDYYWF